MSEHNDFSLNHRLFDTPPAGEGSSQGLGHFLLDDSGGFADVAAGAAPQPDATSERYDSSRLRSESIHERVNRVKSAASPLLEAALPLLRALSEIPEQVNGHQEASLLKETLKREITLFSVVCDEADISWKKMAIVRYCLCTALDEAVLALPWSQEVKWSQSNLLNHFEGDNDGGVKFFLLVGRLSMSPQEYTDVLEIQLMILGLGFEGRYSIVENGERQLNRIRQRLLTLLQSAREDRGALLAPDAIPLRGGAKRFDYAIPVRISALLAGVIIAGSFIYAKYHLLIPESQVITRIDAAARLPEVIPPQPLARLRLATLLQEEIARKLVSVDETPERSLVIFRGDGMFKTGTFDVMESTQDVLRRVAEEIHRVKGKALIVGYTDSQPINKPGIPNNQVLAEKRAASVAQWLEKAGITADRIQVEGKGDSDPVASNATPEGRAQNRRVEILVNY